MADSTNITPVRGRRQAEGAAAYQYAVLRAVPRVEREEFLNVGVLLYCQERDFLGARWSVPAARLRALYADIDLEMLNGLLVSVGSICAGSAAVDASRMRLGTRFGWLTAPRSTVLQPGPVHGGVGPDPETELDRLHRRLVHT